MGFKPASAGDICRPCRDVVSYKPPTQDFILG
jgi:hypothetical protein